MTELDKKLLHLTALRHKRLPELMERLQSGDDYLAGVLQCHLFVESLLEDLIRLCLGRHAEAVLSVQLTFKQKVAIVGKLELEPGWMLVEHEAIGSLSKLNSLRNKLAHRYGHELSEDDIRGLFVGCENTLGYGDVLDAGIKIGISRYAAFIFGSLLPKYERIEDA